MGYRTSVSNKEYKVDKKFYKPVWKINILSSKGDQKWESFRKESIKLVENSWFTVTDSRKSKLLVLVKKSTLLRKTLIDLWT